MIEEIRLKTGESHWLRKGLLIGRTKLVYAGMVSSETYSLVVRSQDGAAAFAYNLYFQKDQPELELAGCRLRVKCVSSREFWCENLGLIADQESDERS